MNLYRYEIGSDDGDEEILAGKRFIDIFVNRNDAIAHIRAHYAPIAVRIECDEPLVGFCVLVAVPVNDNDELPDETLWLCDSMTFGMGAPAHTLHCICNR